jgi:FkbM family methyltransferase
MIEPLLSALVGLQEFRGRKRAIRFLASLRKDVVLRSKYGPLMKARFNDYTCMAGIRGEYGRDVFNAVRSLGSGDCFIDAGANAGIWSLLAGQRVGAEGMVFAFEPQADLAAELVANVKLNRLSNVQVFALALGHETKRSHMANVRDDHTGAAYLGPGTDDDVAGVMVINPSEELPLLRHAVRGRRVMIKIDTEGAELSVLLGLRELIDGADVRTIIVEINPVHLGRFGATTADIFSFLGARGFRPTIRTDAEVMSHAPLHYDEVFTR